MKIAMVFDGFRVGGIERVGLDYAKILISQGHQVTIINLVPEWDEFTKEIPKECRYFAYRYRKNEAPENYTKIGFKGFNKQIQSIAYSYLLEMMGEFRKHTNTYNKIFADETFDLAIAFSGHFNDLSFVARDFVKTRYKLCWLHGALYSYALMSDGYLRLYKKIKNLIVLVDDAQEEVMMYDGDMGLNINKLYNPTSITTREVNDEKVEALKAKYGDFMIMVSRFNYPHKDQYTVAKALDILRREYGQDINLLFLGDGPEEEKVKEYVNSFEDDSRKHIHFLGSIFDVQNYYKAAKLLVHASIAGEGLPTIMLEALANDLPMVVTDSKTGPREILRDNEYGLLCEIRNPEDMASKINRLLTDSQLYKHYMKKSHERLKDFEVETISKKLSMILSKIVDK